MASLLLLLLPIPVLLLFFIHKQRTLKKPVPRPPGPRGLPIIGNLHQLHNSTLHLQLWQLSKLYGPLYSLQLGLRPVLVVSSPKMAEEVLKNHDVEFSGRPSLQGQQKLSYNGLDIVFSPYNDYWREIKKICFVHIFSSNRVLSFSSIRQFEVKKLIEQISRHASSSKVTNLNENLMSLTSTIICRIALGRSFEEEGVERSKFQRLFNEMQALMATFFVSDYIPFMGWIDKLNGLLARLERSFKEMDEFYQEVIDEHLNLTNERHVAKDIIDVLLQLKKPRWFSVDLTIDHIKAVLMNILVAGTDTSAVASIWAMTELMKNPRVMKKVQAEIRHSNDKRSFINEDDIQKLPYMKAVIKETLRLHPPGPLLVPRETNRDCIINGYHIKAKTLVYVNAWAIQRDPETWKDPELFCPERFIHSDIDFKGQDFELIPFGSGCRICPGSNMGIATVELVLANLLYSFDWEIPAGMTVEDIDTEVLIGIAQHKKNPLCLVARNHF